MPSKMKDDEAEVDDAPTNINPYETLGLTTDATSDQVKSAYRKAALRHHPDKAAPEEKDAAHTKFQEIAFAYAVLSDERRRKRYDTTGRTEETLDLEDDDFDWSTFFREQYAEVVTSERIEQFAQEYKGSGEEKKHLLHAYEKRKGDMTKIYEEVMLSDMTEDEDRFREIIDAAIAAEETDAFPKYTAETEKARAKRIASARKLKDKEAEDAKKAAEELEEGSSRKAKGKGKSRRSESNSVGDLAALIQQRQKGRAETFFDNLEAKYGGAGSARGKKRERQPPEEAFEMNKKKSKIGKKA